MLETTKELLYEEYNRQAEKRKFKFTFDDFMEYYQSWKESSFDSFDRYMDYVEKNILSTNKY